MIQREILLKDSICRYSATEIMGLFFTREDVLKEMEQCEVCGFMFYKGDGSKYEDSEYQYDKVCNDCIAALNNGVKYEDISYKDELYLAKFKFIKEA